MRPTLTIGSHMLHTGVRHHASRTTGHHLRIRARVEASLRRHTGELLLLVIHHLLSGWLSSRLLLWGRAVERRSSIVAKAVAGGVHGYEFGASKASVQRFERQRVLCCGCCNSGRQRNV
jgi:hypothetical protein